MVRPMADDIVERLRAHKVATRVLARVQAGTVDLRRVSEAVGEPFDQDDMRAVLDHAVSSAADIERLKRERDEARENYQSAHERAAENLRLVGAIERERDALRMALKPFADHIDDMKFDLDNKGNERPDDEAVGWVYVTNGDFRRARTALNSLPDKG